MIEKIPSSKDMIDLIGEELYKVWINLNDAISQKYEMDCLWNSGGKAWTYEYKYRRGGKTLCALYAKDNSIGFMVIFGNNERLKFEAERVTYSESVQKFMMRRKLIVMGNG